MTDAPGVRRLFVAVDPPPAAAADLATVVEALRVSRLNEVGRSTRVSAQSRWHVTLAFLGDVPTERAEDSASAVRSAVAAWAQSTSAAATSGEAGRIGVRFEGGGTFGRGRFAILWAGLGGDLPALRALSTAVRRELKRARLPYDEKPFRPHLTLARPGDRVPAEALAADVETLTGYAGPMWTVDAVHLVASALGPDPRHTRLISVPLPPAA